MRIILLLIALLSPALLSIPASAQIQTIGFVRVSQDATILRGGKIVPAVIGERLNRQDTLITGPGGSMGVVLEDNSVISLGPETRLTLSEFSFEPRNGKLGFLGDLARGTLEYISGKISKLARDAARFRTPFTTVAVRGTRLLIRVAE